MMRDEVREKLVKLIENKVPSNDLIVDEDGKVEGVQSEVLADFILSPECLNLLAPLYGIDEEKAYDYICDDPGFGDHFHALLKTWGKDDTQPIIRCLAKELAQSDIVKVKEGVG